MKCHLFLSLKRDAAGMRPTSFCMGLHFLHVYMAVYFMNASTFGKRALFVLVSFSTSLQASLIRTRPRHGMHHVSTHANRRDAANHSKDTGRCTGVSGQRPHCHTERRQG